MKLFVFKITRQPRFFKPAILDVLQHIFSTSPSREIAITHETKLNKIFTHLVISIEDTLFTGTKTNGVSNEFSFTQTVNVFLSKHNLYIENNGYLKQTKQFLSEDYQFSFKPIQLSNDFFSRIYKKVNGHLHKVYFVDQFGDKLGENELLEMYDITALPNDVFIHDMTFQPLMIDQSFVTISHEGEMVLSFQSVESFNQWMLMVDEELTNG